MANSCFFFNKTITQSSFNNENQPLCYATDLRKRETKNSLRCIQNSKKRIIWLKKYCIVTTWEQVNYL